MIKLKHIIASTLLLITTATYANSEDLFRTIKRRVESSRIKKDGLALMIADHDGNELFSLNAEKKVIPASLTKLVTAATILDKLPTGHQFVTEIKFDPSQVSQGVLNGPLYLVGGGDAGFVSESLWFLVNEFLRNEIKQINGNIVVDDSRFDQVRFDNSRDGDRTDRAYDSPIGAMTFNWSVVNVFVRPGKSVGEASRVFADPNSNYIQVVNKSKTGKPGKKTEINVSNLGFNSKTNTETILVTGTIPQNSNEFIAYKSVSKPEIWAGENLKEFLTQRAIKVSGKVVAGKVPANAVVGATRKSKPIGEIVSDMMKFSNNYIAEILTKNLAFEMLKKTATMDQGIKIVTDYIREQGISDFQYINPSGLSRKNLFRPTDLIRLLNRMKTQFSIFPEYLSGFPIAGVDGTLKRRLRVEEFLGRVRAKTGHLTGVNGLGGYVSDKTGNAYPFVFIFNGSPDDAARSQDLFDQILLDFLKAK